MVLYRGSGKWGFKSALELDHADVGANRITFVRIFLYILEHCLTVLKILIFHPTLRSGEGAERAWWGGGWGCVAACPFKFWLGDGVVK